MGSLSVWHVCSHWEQDNSCGIACDKEGDDQGFSSQLSGSFRA